MKFLQRLLLVLFLFLVFVTFFKPITAWTQDLGRHLKVGETILSTMSVPKENLFSYTYPHFPFINSHWFSEVIFLSLYRMGGDTLLLFVMSTVGTAAIGLVLFFCIKKYGLPSSPLLVMIGLLYLQVLKERTDLRPELFSFLFTSIFLVLLYSFREKPTKKVLYLIPLSILWVNTHIYFLIGILLLTVFFIDALWRNRKKLKFTEVKLLFSTLLLSTFGIMMNPNGITGALYPFRVMQNYGYSIQENQHIFFLWEYSHSPTILFFFCSLLLLGISFLSNLHRLRLVDLLLSLVFSLLACSAIRHFPLFVLITYPVITYNFWSSFKEIRPSYRYVPILYFFLILFLVWQIVAQTQSNRHLSEVGAKNAVTFFLKNKLTGPLFNNFDIGSYLIYRLSPGERVFVDGRPEAYPASFFQNVYIPMQQDLQLFKKWEAHYGFNTIFFSHTDQTPWAQIFLKQITKDPTWRMVYLDEYAVIFIKVHERNAALLARFPDQKETLALAPTTNTTNISSLMSLASFFQKAGWSNREQETFARILGLDPTNCTALYYLALSQDSITATIYKQKYYTYCQ